MAHIDAKDDNQIEFARVGGLNERPSNASLPPPDFGLVHGLYMSEEGSLTRLAAIEYINRASSETVLQIRQLDDGTGSIVAQYADGTERIFTLAEIFGRTGDESDLTISGDVIGITEDGFPQALIVHEEAQGTDGGAIGSNLNAWYRWKLTGNPTNESTIVTTFNDYTAGGGNENTFILGAGTYRIEAYAVINAAYNALNTDLRTCTITVGTPAVVTNIAHGLSAGDSIQFVTATGATLPTGLSINTVYFVLLASITADTFRVSATIGGAAINTTVAGNGAIYLWPQPKSANAVAVLYDESNAAVVGVFTPAVLRSSNPPLGGNPNFPQSRQSNLCCMTAFEAVGSAFYSIKVAAASASGSQWNAAVYARGRSHGVTATLNGSSASNRYLAIKITMQNES